MDHSYATCCPVVAGAAAGRPEDRNNLVHSYSPLVHTYLRTRWRHSTLIEQVDDAAQEVFLELFRSGGALDRFDPKPSACFRRFLHGVMRNVAARVEERHKNRRRSVPLDCEFHRVHSDEENPSRVLDRQWARALIRQAFEKMAENARRIGDEALRRVDILRLRFYDGMPIRDIARHWGTARERLHKQYAKARREFRAALEEVLAISAVKGDLESELTSLVGLLTQS